MNRNTFITLGILVLIIIIVGYFAFRAIQLNNGSGPSPAQSALSSGANVSKYSDLSGNPVSLEEYFGKVIVVNSWASWCPSCGQELVELADVGDIYKDREVVILAMNRAEPTTTAQAYMKPLVVGSAVQLVLDPQDSYYESIQGFTMPETVFYDSDGNITFHKRGDMSLDDMIFHIDAALTASEK